jgi:hypothetical protein
VVFEKEYIMRCSSVEWIARNRCALRWCHRHVGRWSEKTVGFPEWIAQFSVWSTIGKDSSEACAIACQNCAVYSVFPSGMTSQSKIAQLNWWEYTGRFMKTSKEQQWAAFEDCPRHLTCTHMFLCKYSYCPWTKVEEVGLRGLHTHEAVKKTQWQVRSLALVPL